MIDNNCWYCTKELSEPTITYTRLNRKQKKRIELTVHAECYKRVKRVRNKFRPTAPGSMTQ